MLNQAVVEALYSATFIENYLDCVENLPNDIQRHVSRLRELDATCQSEININFELSQNIELLRQSSKKSADNILFLFLLDVNF